MKSVRYCFAMILFLFNLGFPATYWGAEYRTHEGFVYGRFEARYKPPYGSGMLASFFTYHDITSSTAWNEIDFEILGRYTNDVQVTSIGPGQSIRNSHQHVPFIPQEDFHTYAFEWTPEYIAWFIDDEEVYRQDQAHIQNFKHPQKIMMNIWSPEWAGWSGPWDDRILPLFAWYDWVSYASHTPGSGNSGTGNNFTLQWKDEFDTWDQARWGKGTHTFGGNRVTFKPENVIFKDGCMVLCLTKDPNLGYSDKTPPAMLWARAQGDTVHVHFSENIDPATANVKTNFSITGVTIHSAALQSDQRTVKLAVSGLDAAKSYTVVALGIKDVWSPANRLGGQVQAVTMVKPLTLPVKINVGGPAWRDYLPDQEWGPTVEYGHQDGYKRAASNSVAHIDVLNTSEDSLYYTELHELVNYKVRVPNGRYRVTLKMAEMDYSEALQRYFDIFVQGRPVAERLDLVVQPGPRTAHEIVIEDVIVDNGILEMHFDNLWGFSLLNAMVIEASPSGVGSGKTQRPEAWAMVRNYPNPFNASTRVLYEVPDAGTARVRVYDRLGREVAELAHARVTAGVHEVRWAPDLPSGLYFLNLDHHSGKGISQAVHKMVLLR